MGGLKKLRNPGENTRGEPETSFRAGQEPAPTRSKTAKQTSAQKLEVCILERDREVEEVFFLKVQAKAEKSKEAIR